MARRRREQQVAQQAGAQANRARNSQLLAAYAANPSSIPNPSGPASTPAYTAPKPADPGVAPQPLDPGFMQQQASAQRNLQVSQLGGLYQGAQINNEYGFGSDKSNPYSQAKLLEESYKRSKLGTTNNYASAGQRHSTAYDRMQGENARNYSIGVDRGTRDMNNALAQNQLGQLQAGADYGIGLTDADFSSLLNAFKQRFG